MRYSSGMARRSSRTNQENAMDLFDHEQDLYQPSAAERQEAAGAVDFERAPGHLAAYDIPRFSPVDEWDDPGVEPLLPYGVPGNGISQLVGAFSRGGRR